MLSAIAIAALIQSAPVSEDIFILSEPAPPPGSPRASVGSRAAAGAPPG